MMQTRGLELILYNLNLSEKLFRKAMKKAIKAGGEVLDKEIIKNISLICHSLEDLKRMGHPYGKKPRPGRMPIPHTPKWLVHMQTGDLRKSFFSCRKLRSRPISLVCNGSVVGKIYNVISRR